MVYVTSVEQLREEVKDSKRRSVRKKWKEYLTEKIKIPKKELEEILFQQFGEEIIEEDVSPENFEIPNINFNPFCKSVSLTSFYFTPSLAISKKDLHFIINVEEIEGKVKIKKEKFISRNLIIGNLENPRFVIFAHYDTIKKGAIDNSSGVAILLSLIKENPKTLSNTLFVFSGSEELSFEKPIYWGKGYRVFEEEFKEVLKNSKKIIVVDCIGFDKPILTKKLLEEALPLKNLSKWYEKSFLLVSNPNNIKKLWEIYHSDLDKIEFLDEKYLKIAKNKTLSIIKR